MSVPLTVNGAIFNYPVNFDTNWGVDATGWAQAVTAGMLQKSGGTFPLTAEVDFGASFGIKSLYFKSRTANPSTAGTLRLASADPGIGFRKNDLSGNLILTTDSSDNLLYNGHIIAPSGAGTVTSIIGTANQVIASSPTGNVTLSLPQSIATTSSPTFAALTLTAPLTVPNGGTGDASLTAYAVLTGGTTSTASVQSIASVGLAGQVLTSNGPGALPSFSNTTGSGTVNSGTAGNIAYYATSSAAVSDAGIARTNIFLADGTISATGAFNLNSHKVTNLTNGSNPQDAVAFTQLSTGNAITAGGITNATITTTQVASNTLTGSTANSGGSAGNIAQGTISTPDLRANTVTNIQTSESNPAASTGVDITTTTITTIGKPVLITAMVYATDNGGVGAAQIHVLNVNITRGATNLASASQGIQYAGTAINFSSTSYTVPLIYVDTPAAGTYTYHLAFIGSGAATYTVIGYTLSVIELRA